MVCFQNMIDLKRGKQKALGSGGVIITDIIMDMERVGEGRSDDCGYHNGYGKSWRREE